MVRRGFGSKRAWIGLGFFAAAVTAAAGCGSDSGSSGTSSRGRGVDAGYVGTGGYVGAGGAAAATGAGGAAATTGAGGAGAVAAGGTGATPATGGAPSTGGSAGSMGMDGGMMSTDGGMGGRTTTCEPPADPVIDPAALPDCTIDNCTNARCVGENLVPEDSRSNLATCGDKMLCVPDNLLETAGNFLVDVCTSINGAEGRCLSTCIPQVSSQAAFLPQDICADGEKCAPCFDPRTGEDTTACSQGCDGGPIDPTPVLFDKCCGGVGSCVPTDAVPESDRSLLGTDTCTGDGQLCAPDKLADTTFIPKSCRSLGDVEGRCMPSCLPDVQARADALPQADCDAGELCAPCFDPLTGEDTGACTRNGDMPAEDVVTFPDCCGTEGKCVPLEGLTDDQKALLGQDSCEDGSLCAPKVFAVPDDRAKTCRSIENSEGRCVPTCVPQVADQADRLEQASCESTQLCTPCTDPITGEDTGACSQNGDSPKEEKFVFPKCCNDIGVCVPTNLVPTDQQAQLGTDTCTGTDVLCAPKKLASDSSAIPATCTSLAGAEGRCIAACLPAVADRADSLPQDTCDDKELCAPCYDPLSGDSTGACELNGDAPTDPPVVFDQECCGTTGLCVPSAAVPADQVDLLVPDNCTSEGSDWLCAPKIKLNDVNAPFDSCTPTLLGIPGTPGTGGCVPQCITDSQIAGNPFLGLGISQSNCPDGYMCAPCTNPLDQTDTGACN